LGTVAPRSKCARTLLEQCEMEGDAWGCYLQGTSCEPRHAAQQHSLDTSTKNFSVAAWTEPPCRSMRLSSAHFTATSDRDAKLRRDATPSWTSSKENVTLGTSDANIGCVTFSHRVSSGRRHTASSRFTVSFHTHREQKDARRVNLAQYVSLLDDTSSTTITRPRTSCVRMLLLPQGGVALARESNLQHLPFQSQGRRFELLRILLEEQFQGLGG
jgi:hypothetical protein